MTLSNPKVAWVFVLFSTLSINLFAQEVNCSDGIDNDGDNLVDYYDDDCPCDGENYYGTCATACSATTFPPSNFSMAEQWRTDNVSYPIDNRQVAMVADIDADGYPDVIVKDDGHVSELYVFDGRDGSHKLTINAPKAQVFNIGVAVADVDLDGFGEIILNTQDKGNDFDYKRRLVCYDHNGTEKWIANKQTGAGINDGKLTPGIADFNGDGVPEIFVGNEIYNAQTGEFIAAGGSSKGENLAAVGEAFTVAADVLPTAFCGHCGGLELVAGNVVYAVDIAGASMAVAMTAPVAIPDGFTAVADIDNDNDYDAVLTSGGKVYAWDLQTSTQLGTTFDIGSASAATSNSPAGGIANVADFDGDGQAEIGLAGKNVYVVIEYNTTTNVLEELWSKYVKDGSGRTGSSVFDFEGDGFSELIYKGETYLWVLDGSTGAIKAQVECGSGTRTDYPLVVDVDADGATEIVCTCSDSGGPGSANNGYVIAFEATDRPWVHARKLWNQFQYNITNINDDLTVPIVPQKGFYLGTKFNNYLSQVPILDEFGDYVIKAADLSVNIISTDVSSCGTSQIGVSIEVFNQGSATANAGTPIAFYEENPTGLSSYIGVGYTTEDLDNGDSETIILTLAVGAQPATFNLYAVVNSTLTNTPFSYTTDFPAGPVSECDYTNNTDNTPAGCCGVSSAGEIAGFEQTCIDFDPALITSVDPGGDVCVSGNVYTSTGTNGADDLNYYSSITAFTGTDPAFSIEFWAKPMTVTNNSHFMLFNGPTNTEDIRFQIVSGENIRIRLGGTQYTNVAPLVVGVWQHIVVTYSASTVKFYVNGILGTTLTNTNTAGIEKNVDLQIGKKQVGQMDNIKLHKGALSEIQVNEAMDNCNYSNNGSVIHWWNFDSNSGADIAVDLIGNANLTFTGAGNRMTPGAPLPSAGPVDYKWESAMNIEGPWFTIPTSNTETFDPGSIAVTTYFRRGIDNGASCENTYTNIVEKRIASVLNDGGDITGDEEGCSGFDPVEITESVVPEYSGATAPTMECQWQNATSPDGPWSDIGGAVANTYDPSAITETTYYQRITREVGCAGDFYSDNIVEKKIISSTFYLPGSISGEEAGCPAYTPTTIVATDPLGVYNYVYQWESAPSESGPWTNIVGATNKDFTFSINLLTTTYYRRLISDAGCTVYNASNVVAKLVKTDITDGGALSSDESFCYDYDPGVITSTAPSGGGPYEYIWEQTDGPDNAWTIIGGAISDSYDPPAITATTYYRRGVKSTGPNCTVYTYTDPVTKEIFTTNVEQNEFSGDEYECGSFDPSVISDEQSPSSGVDYEWESTLDVAGPWTEIGGANGATYDPTTISSTTYYRRKIRESGCSDWQEPLDYVTKDIDCQCGTGTVYLPGADQKKVASDFCNNDVWAYYFDPANPSQLLFAIEQFPAGGNTNPFTAEITIETTESITGTTTYADSVYWEEDNIAEEVNYVMGRDWNINFTSGSPNGPINIRFFYEEKETDRIEGLAEAWKETSPSAPNPRTVGALNWFKTNEAAYDPNKQVTATGFNTAYSVLNPAEYGYVNGIKYVQFDGLTDVFGGSAANRAGIVPVLPVELISFNGEVKEKVNQLYWRTASELNFSHFKVERRNEEGLFEVIGDPIKGKGSAMANYIFFDESPFSGNNYYRLMMIDEDGSIRYSGLLVINRGEEHLDVFTLYPNPVDKLLNYKFVVENNGPVYIRLVDVVGNVLYEERRDGIVGLLLEGRFNVDHFPAGVYMFQAVNGDEVKAEWFMVGGD